MIDCFEWYRNPLCGLSRAWLVLHENPHKELRYHSEFSEVKSMGVKMQEILNLHPKKHQMNATYFIFNSIPPFSNIYFLIPLPVCKKNRFRRYGKTLFYIGAST